MEITSKSYLSLKVPTHARQRAWVGTHLWNCQTVQRPFWRSRPPTITQKKSGGTAAMKPCLRTTKVKEDITYCLIRSTANAMTNRLQFVGEFKDIFIKSCALDILYLTVLIWTPMISAAKA